MIGMIRVLSSLLLLVILSGCMKTTCLTDTDCKKTLDWNNPSFQKEFFEEVDNYITSSYNAQQNLADHLFDAKKLHYYEDKVRMKQAEMDRKKGLLSKEEFESFTGKEDVCPGVKTKIVYGVKTKVVETA